jgi:type IV pilus assembly protein PilM
MSMLALINAFELNYRAEVVGQVIALVHIGASMMTVLIVKDGLSTFQRDIPLGGNQYTAALQKAFGLSREDAEAVKLGARPGDLAQADMLAVLRAVTEELIAEIQRSFEFYLAGAGDEPIERLYLSGGSSRMQGLSQVLASRFNLPAEPLNPFRCIEIPEQLFAIDYVHDMGPMAVVAAGLALRRKGDR